MNPHPTHPEAVADAAASSMSRGNQMTTAHIKALDLFAGTGWGVACQRLKVIKEDGVEIMPEAVATREANGMTTIYRDVWDGLRLTKEEHRARYGSYGLKIASPPCQTFSLAGNGSGRAALNEVLEAIELHAYKDADALLAFGEKHDMRTALVLTPLAYVWRDRPKLVAWEQVPTVLPVWEACAEVMREWGYDVKTEILNAEQYGVPQTRRRAILVARLGGPVHLPIPTHSRYYSRTPEKLDPGVRKWVSMAEALGWTTEEADGSTYTGNNKLAHQAVRSLDQPAPTVTAGHDSGNRGFIDPDGQFFVADVEQVSALQSYPAVVYRNGNQANAARRTLDQPAPTLLFGHNSNKVEWMDPELAAIPSASGKRVTVEEAAALQSYPTGRGLIDRPSPTITGGGVETGGAEPIAKYHERYTSALGWVGSTERLTTDEAAALQTYPVAATKPQTAGRTANYGTRPDRPADAPAFTIVGHDGHPRGGFEWRNEDGTTRRLATEEVGTLQTYEPPFIWCGTKTKQFLQIGNAVPPLLAEHVLAALIGITEGR